MWGVRVQHTLSCEVDVDEGDLNRVGYLARSPALKSVQRELRGARENRARQVFVHEGDARPEGGCRKGEHAPAYADVRNRDPARRLV
jgi:hypothetical protein